MQRGEDAGHADRGDAEDARPARARDQQHHDRQLRPRRAPCSAHQGTSTPGATSTRHACAARRTASPVMLAETMEGAGAAVDDRLKGALQGALEKECLAPESPRASRTTREVSASALREPAMLSRPCSSRGGALYSSRHTPQRYARSAHASTLHHAHHHIPVRSLCCDITLGRVSTCASWKAPLVRHPCRSSLGGQV